MYSSRNTILIAIAWSKSYHRKASVPYFTRWSTRNRPMPITVHRRSLWTSWLPETIQSISIWGGSGFLLKTIHSTTGLPHWACFAAISVGVRTILFPLVLYGAKTSAKFAKVIPDVQFLITLFQRDMKMLREKNAPLSIRTHLMKTNLKSLNALYKRQKINPLSIFYSPILQIPFFWYISIDLRKIVNGLDPELAQQLVENGVAWLPDLTEPDPFYGLPILAGLMLYGNVEVATGRHNLVGKSAAKADTAVLLKDIFQSVAIFMPCFTATLAGGVQIYIVTSFFFTLVQSAALRTESFRSLVGLPSLLSPPPEISVAEQMIKLKGLEVKARELRGDGPVLGKHSVLATGAPEASFLGTIHKSCIKVDESLQQQVDQVPLADLLRLPTERPAAPDGVGFIHGVSAPIWQIQEQGLLVAENKNNQNRAASQDSTSRSSDREYMPQIDDDLVEKANRGEIPRPIQFVKENTIIKHRAPKTMMLRVPKPKIKGKRKKR